MKPNLINQNNHALTHLSLPDDLYLDFHAKEVHYSLVGMDARLC